MKFSRWLNIVFLAIFLSACGSGGPSVLPVNPTAALPPPAVTVVSASDPTLTLTSYLEAYKADDYNTMYGLLSKVTQDSVTLEDFAKRNRDALNQMSAGSFDYMD